MNAGTVIHKPKILAEELVSLSFGIKNLTNLKNIISLGGGVHSSSESIISWGRTFFVNLKTNFV